MRRDDSLHWLSRPFDASFHFGLSAISYWIVVLLQVATFSALVALRATRMREYTAQMLVLLGAMTGVFAAKDLLLFALFWDLMLIPVFLLMIGWGTPGGGPRRTGTAAWRYLIYNLAGGLCLLLGDRRVRRRERLDRRDRQSARRRDDRQRLGRLDLQRVRFRVLGQNAGLPVPHLDAGDVRRIAAAGRRRGERRAIEGRALRLHRDRAAVLCRADARCDAADGRAGTDQPAVRRADLLDANRRQTDRGVQFALASGA